MLPFELGYHMPAEWEPHERTLISWPVKSSAVHPEEYGATCRGYAGIIAAVAEFEPVTVLANPGDAVVAGEGVELLELPHDDAWVRDNGPTFLRDSAGALAAVNWKFNAWGGKYPRYELDDLLTPRLLDILGVRRFNAPLVMEGGSFHTDGEGTLLVTEQCLLGKNRNPALAKADIEEKLRQYLGVQKVLWLPRGLDGDETDGHVDNVACFAGPGRILMQVCDDPADENFAVTRANLAALDGETDARGRRLEIVPVPQPPRREKAGARLTLSYLNFYLPTGGIVLPVFGAGAGETDADIADARITDARAKEIIGGAFPGRRLRTVDGMGIAAEGGNVHCITQQMPKGAFGGDAGEAAAR